MKQTTLIKIAVVFCLVGSTAALAQFNSGSTGADGELIVTNDLTLDLPTNGVFNFTTLNVSTGATLRYNRNPLNTPVYLLATGDVLINGTIDVSGSSGTAGNPGIGGPGGFSGGFGSFQGFPPGDGFGPGGGRVGVGLAAAFASPADNGNNTNTYGNTLLSPLIGGSGGAGSLVNGLSFFGGGGGGALLIASSTRINVVGAILSRGGRAQAGGNGHASGGAIRLVAPTVTGAGSLDVAGGNSNASSGRTRVDALDRFAHRSLNMGGKATRGSQMFVFPLGNPKLDIINAAGTPIPEGTNAPVTVNLLVGSSTNQLVRVQARGFTNDVPIRVKITPENASSATFDGTILQSSGNPPFADVQVNLPVDTVCHVHAWTR